MARNTMPAHGRELDDDAAAAIFFAVVEHKPNLDELARGELASWLRRQQRAEVRAELAAAGPL
jgi:hypothetical protein